MNPTVFVLVTAIAVLQQGAPPAADLILVNGRVVTCDAAVPEAEAVGIRDGHIVYVGTTSGSRAWRDAGTRWIDLERATVTPGLVDGHGHLPNLARTLRQVKLAGTQSMADVHQRTMGFVTRARPGEWVQGRGWDQNDWDNKDFPTWQDLSGTESNPVYLRRVDGHAVLLNRTALELCRISRDTADPDGGRIVRFADGEPTGVLIDNAVDIARLRIPAETDAELDTLLHHAIASCNRMGLTGVHEAGCDRRTLESLRRLSREGSLTLRVYAMLDDSDPGLVDEWLAKGPSVEADGYLTVRAIKVYADGALGSRGAALLAPYDDDPGNAGLLVNTPEYILQRARQALAAGFQLCVHGIGDRGNRVALDAMASALVERPTRDHRFRIEHAQVLSPEDIARFSALGVIPSMQPAHATSDMYWAEDRIGPERIRGAYAWRRLIAAGNRIVLGSDFPVESHDPVSGMYAAVMRQDSKGWPEDGWRPQERLTRMEALEGYTVNAAYASFMEKESGRIAVGYRADLSVFAGDLLNDPVEGYLQAMPLYTIVGGAVVHDSSSDY